ncbi:hypothetical protein IZU99_01580 [Oscillospiraceae bacterium CM]|jgi:hypothetical protein|nr:hypothetical protein IZU99_01580 [Oscillospiraceae bacterium CM]
MSLQDSTIGSLIGGSRNDAPGCPVELMSLSEKNTQCGKGVHLRRRTNSAV